MRAIILAAGKSSRFAADGWTIPKHLLPMPGGRRLIEWQEERMFNITDDVWTVLNRDNAKQTIKYLRGKHAVVSDSCGVLNTLLKVIHLCFTKLPVVVTYCDSFLKFSDYKMLEEMSPWLEAINVCFPATNKRFNYPVKGFADGGIFKFKSGWTIIRAMMKYRPPYTDKDGLYLLVKALKQKTYYISYKHTDLGTPEDYKSFMQGHGQKVEMR